MIKVAEIHARVLSEITVKTFFITRKYYQLDELGTKLEKIGLGKTQFSMIPSVDEEGEVRKICHAPYMAMSGKLDIAYLVFKFSKTVIKCIDENIDVRVDIYEDKNRGYVLRGTIDEPAPSIEDWLSNPNHKVIQK